MNDIIDHKTTIIHRSLARIREVFHLTKDRLDTDLTSQTQLSSTYSAPAKPALDIANYFNKTLFSIFPESSRERFEALHKSGLISAQLAPSLQELIGFSCEAVRGCQPINPNIVKSVVEHRLGSFKEYAETIKTLKLQS